MLSCGVKVLDQNTDSYQLLMRYINSGRASKDKEKRKYTLRNIYEVSSLDNKNDTRDPALF